ncbi:MAG: RHS repeat domain-containing protein [Rhodanobacter sp.]
MRACSWIVLLGLAVLVPISEQCHAQAAPESEYKQLINVHQDIQPLGDNPFGEQIGLYNGALSFAVTDISQPGNGPELKLGRSLQIAEDVHNSDGIQRPFGEWRLDIPRIETNTGFQANVLGWDVGNVGDPGYLNRCTVFRAPPPVQASIHGFAWNPAEWWYGYHLIVPGYGNQILMPRGSGNTHAPTIAGKSFPIVTKQDWMITCGVTASDGGEGFLAIAPDGTRYTFAHLVYRSMTYLEKPYDAAPNLAGGVQPMEESSNILARREAAMYVTQIQDRFGNTLTYNWSGDDLSSIVASDGRKLTLSYVSGKPMIHAATLQSLNGPTRTWTYGYDGNSVFPSLTSVQLPDGSAWSYQIGNLESAALAIESTICDAAGDLHAQPAVGSMIHPSGLMATFTVTPTLHGRSYVPRDCRSYSGSTKTYANIPSVYYQYSVTKEVLSGAGITPAKTWTWSYSAPNQSWLSDACASGGTCPSTVYTDVTDPDNKATRYTFSNRYDVTEGQLKRTDYYSGAVGSPVIQSVSDTYANPSEGPWPSYGDDLQARDNFDQVEEFAPLQKRDITQDGDTYTWQAEAFNTYAQVTKTKRFNTISWQPMLEEQTSYLNDLPHWVLGLPQQITNLTTGETEILNTYNLSNVTLQSHARFGQTLMSYTFNSAGQLASFTDGNSHTTTLGSYKRGIPQAIGYPDGTSQTLLVDDFGQIASITDQAGSTTHYSYDPVGRITGISYPTGDEVAWLPTTFTYTYVTSAERGLSANHWRRTTTTGSAVAVTYFDAMLRPVLSDSKIGSTVQASALNTYNFRGQKVFSAYPSGTALTFSTNPTVNGDTTTYDALGRVTQVVQDSELGLLTTSTAYLSGARQRVTDPKGNVTTTSYQVFDQPGYDAVIKVQAPAGITQAIARDLYGNPLSITQSGLYGTENDSVTKTLAYDSYHRLCRRTEPESGSTVIAYDSANNLAWSAEGLAITGTGCGQEQVAAAAKTTRTYDAMNRVLTILPPSGTQSTTYTYDTRGNLASASSGISYWWANYNTRGNITGEALWLSGQSAWGIGYAYDAYNHLATISYPGSPSESVAYAPDALGRPTKAGGYASSVKYFPDGQEKSYTLDNGINAVRDENIRQLPSNLSYGLGASPRFGEDYSYDANGNLTAVADLYNGQNDQTLSYDALNRLTSASAPHAWGTEVYAYDALNNLRQRVTGGLPFNLNVDAYNRLTSMTIGSNPFATYVNDASGDRIATGYAGTTTNYVFDAKHQLLGIPGRVNYAYDAAGRRVAKTPAVGAAAAATYSFYNQAGRLMFGYDAATGQGTNYIYLNGKLIARHKGSTVTYLLTDRLGSPVREADASGNVTASFSYRPYGSLYSGPNQGEPGFTGHVNDPETAFVYMQQRYYDAGTGRFLSVDLVGPVPGDVFGFNRYDYANNNPVVNVDPDGRAAKFAELIRLVGSGMRSIARVSHEEAVIAKKAGGDVRAATRQEAHQIANAASEGRGVVKDAAHELEDGSKGLPHYHTLDTKGGREPGHVFWGKMSVILIAAADAVDKVADAADYIPDPTPRPADQDDIDRSNNIIDSVNKLVGTAIPHYSPISDQPIFLPPPEPKPTKEPSNDHFQ